MPLPLLALPPLGIEQVLVDVLTSEELMTYLPDGSALPAGLHYHNGRIVSLETGINSSGIVMYFLPHWLVEE